MGCVDQQKNLWSWDEFAWFFKQHKKKNKQIFPIFLLGSHPETETI